MRVRGVAAPGLGALLLVLAAWSLVPVPVGAEATDDITIEVSNFAFTPDDATIEVGETVTWTWVSGTHSVELEDGTEVWCPVQSDGTCEKTFDTVGTYSYICGVHPSSMTATLTVASPPVELTVTGPADGDVVGDEATFSGTASHPAGITKVTLAGGGISESVSAPGGTTFSFTLTLPLTAIPDGALLLNLTAHAADGATGAASRQVTHVTPGAVHDLAVLEVAGETGFGTTVVTATVANQGDVAIDGAELLFEYEYQGVWHPIETVVLLLQDGASQDMGVVWQDSRLVGQFDVRATLTTPDGIVDTDPADNEGTGTAAFWTDLVPGTDLGDPL